MNRVQQMEESLANGGGIPDADAWKELAVELEAALMQIQGIIQEVRE